MQTCGTFQHYINNYIKLFQQSKIKSTHCFQKSEPANMLSGKSNYDKCWVENQTMISHDD